MNQQVSPGTLETIYEAVKDRLTTQLNEVNALDNKTGILIGFNGVILTIAFTSAKPGFLPTLILALLLISGSIALAIFVFRTTKGELRRDPDPAELWRAYSTRTKDEVLDALIRGLIASFDHNRASIKRKSGRFNLALYGSAAGSLLIAVSMLGGK